MLGTIWKQQKIAMRLISGFLADRRANIAVVSALSAIPVITAIGCVVDHSTATIIKTKLQAAAGGATLDTVSATSRVIAPANPMPGTGSVTCSRTSTQNLFDLHLGSPAAPTG